MVPFPEIVNPSALSAFTNAAKYDKLCPSMRVSIIGKLLISSLPFKTASSSRYRWVFGLKKREPLRYVPLGMTITPPPCWDAWSMTDWIFSVWRRVLSLMTPYSRMLYFLPNVWILTTSFCLNQSGMGVPSGNFSSLNDCKLINAVKDQLIIYVCKHKKLLRIMGKSW